MLQLTSYDRMRRYICNSAGEALTDTKAQKQAIVNWITAASKQIETYLNRNMAYTAYIEYFDTPKETFQEFFVGAPPVSSLTDVYLDPDGEWDGDESEVTDCFVGSNGDSVVLPIEPAALGKRTHRVRYVGGMALYGTRSVFTISGSSGTWTVGSFVYGGTSEAVGILKAATATSLTVEILYGIFQAGEALTEYSDEDLTTVGDASATLSAVAYPSLAEQYPDIVRAAEIQVRHYWKHKDDFEASSAQRDGTNQRYGSERRPILLSEAMNLLAPYRRQTVV